MADPTEDLPPGFAPVEEGPPGFVAEDSPPGFTEVSDVGDLGPVRRSEVYVARSLGPIQGPEVPGHEFSKLDKLSEDELDAKALRRQAAEDEKNARIAEAFTHLPDDPRMSKQALASAFKVETAVVEAHLPEFIASWKKATAGGVGPFDGTHQGQIDNAQAWRQANPELAKILFEHPDLGKEVLGTRDVPGLVKGLRAVQDGLQDYRLWVQSKLGGTPGALSREIGALLEGPPTIEGPKGLSAEDRAVLAAGPEATSAAREKRDAPVPALFRETERAAAIREGFPVIGPPVVRVQEAWRQMKVAELSSHLAWLALSPGDNSSKVADLQDEILDLKRGGPLNLKEAGWGKWLAEATTGATSTVAAGALGADEGGAAAALAGAGVGGARTKSPAGALVGGAAGLIAYGTAKLETGSVMDESAAWRTDDNKPLDIKLRAGAAFLYGSLATAEEFGEYALLFGAGKAVSGAAGAAGVKSAVKGAIKQGLLKSPEFRATLGKIAAAYAGEPGEEGLQALTQEAVSYLARSVAQGAPSSKGIGQAQVEGALEQAQAAFAFSSIQTSATIIAAKAGAILKAGQNNDGNGQAKAVATSVKDRAVAAGIPSVIAEVVQDVTEKTGAPVTHFYVDAAALENLQTEALFQSPAEDAPSVAPIDDLLGPGGAQKLEDAVAVGGKVEVPVARYVEHWAGTPAAAKLEGHTVTRPGHLSAEEIKADPTRIDEQTRQIVAEAEAVKALNDDAEKQFKGFETEVAALEIGGKPMGKGKAAAAGKLFRGLYRTTLAGYGVEAAKSVLEQLKVEISNGGTGVAAMLQSEESKAALVERSDTPELLASDINIDSVTGLRTYEGWRAAPRQEGKQVFVVTLPDIKPINDSPDGGHDTANALLAHVADVIATADPEAARKGTNFLFHGDQATFDAVLAAVGDRLPEGMSVEGAVSSDPAKPFAELDASVDAKRKAGTIPQRGETKFDLSKVKGLEATLQPSTVKPNLSPAMLDAARNATPEQKRAAYRDTLNPDVLNGVGFEQAGPRAFVGSADVADLKADFNEAFSTGIEGSGKWAGDLAIAKVAEVAAALGGKSVDFAHLSGDEYAFKHDDRAQVEEFAADLQAALLASPVRLQWGGKTYLVPVKIRIGIGEKTYGAADRALNTAKAAERARGSGDRFRRLRQAMALATGPAASAARQARAIRRQQVEAEAVDRGGVGQGNGGLTLYQQNPMSAEDIAAQRAVIARMKSKTGAAWATAQLDFVIGKGERPGAGGLSQSQRDKLTVQLADAGFPDPEMKLSADGKRMEFPKLVKKTAKQAAAKGGSRLKTTEERIAFQNQISGKDSSGKGQLFQSATPHDAAVSEHEAGFKDSRTEFSAVVSPSGETLLFHGSGKASKVSFTWEQIGLISGKNATFTHNHPNGLSLSVEDLVMAMMIDASEMRATAPDGSVWSVVRPSRGWGDVASNEAQSPEGTKARLEMAADLERQYRGAVMTAKWRMHDAIAKAGGNPAEGPKAKGYSDEKWNQILGKEVSKAFNAYAELRDFGWQIERLEPGGVHSGRQSTGVRAADGAPTGVVGGQLFQPAFHGTPHNFDEFKLTAMGTGEGAQVYGWGMYFSGKKAVAEHYRESLIDTGLSLDGKDRASLTEDERLALHDVWLGVSTERTNAFNDGKPAPVKVSIGAALEHAKTRARERLAYARQSGSEEGGRVQQALRTLSQLEKMNESRLSQNVGQTFEVDVPEDHELLDYDKSIEDQPEAVLQKLESSGIVPNATFVAKMIRDYQNAKVRSGPVWDSMVDWWEDFHKNGGTLPNGERFAKGTKGREIYAALKQSKGGAEEASKALLGAGIPGLRYLDSGSRSEGQGSHNYVIWDESRMPITQKLYAGTPDSSRGSVERMRKGVNDIFKIVINPTADLSTLLHEGGHVFLEIFADLAARSDAPAQVLQDWADVLAYLGPKLPERNAAGWSFTRAQHEKWADSWLAWLREGKAPSKGLVGAFNRFGAWLKSIYQAASQLGVELSPEIRGVFERLVATEEEIQAMKREMGKPLFGTLAEALAAGLSPSQYEGWLEDQAAAQSHAERAAKLAHTKDELRKKTKEYREALERETTAAEAEYDALPAARAKAALQGKILPGELVVVASMNREAVEAMVGEAQARKFRLSKDGVHPDEIAPDLGFDTGEAMLKAVEVLPPKSVWVQKLAEHRTAEANPGLLEERAQLAEVVGKGMHGDDSERALLKEIAAITAKARGGARPVESIQAAAQQIVDRTAVGAIKPSRALQAERTAANRAVKEALKGNWGEVLTQKHKQLLSMYLYRNLLQAKEDMAKLKSLAKDLKKTSARERLGKASPKYLGGVDLLLEAVGEKEPEARDVPLPSIGEVIAQMELELTPVLFDKDAVSALLAKSVPMAPENPTALALISYAQAKAVSDALKNVQGAARSSTTVTDGEKRADKDFIITEAVREATENKRAIGGSLASTRSARTVGDILRSLPSTITGPALKIEVMTEWLGGSLTGKDPQESVWFKYFLKPMQDAKVRESDLMKSTIAPILQAFEDMPAEVRRRSDEAFNGKQFFPEHAVNSGQGLAAPTKRFEIMMMALHMGSQSSADRLTLGRNITEAEVMAAINTLTKAELDWVQTVLDATDSLKDPAFDVAERESGLRPKAIQARPLRTVHGVYRGGYFPAMYDSRVERAGKIQDSSQFMDPTFGKAGTPHGFTSARSEGFTGALSLEPGDIPRHLAQVAHYVAYQEAVKSVGALIISPAIQSILLERLGEGRAKQFEQWVKDIGTARGVDGSANAGAILKLAKTVRANVAVSALGYSMKNAIEDFSALVYAIPATDLTARNMAAGVLEFSAAPLEKIAEVESKSGTIRAANDQRMRDLTQRIEALALGSPLALRPFRFLRRHAFVMMEMSFKSTSTPVWLGAYRQGLALDKGEAHAIEFADRVVRRAFPMNALVDQAGMVRDKGYIGTLLQFYGFQSAAGNVTMDLLQKFAEPADGLKGRLKTSARLMGFLFGVSVVGGFLRGKGPDEDETWAEWVARQMLTEQMAQIPIVGGDVGNWAHAKLKGKPWQARPSYLVGAALGIGEAVMALGDENASTAKKVIAIARAAGPLGLAGSSQAISTVKYWTDLDSGDAQSSGILDDLSGSIYGNQKTKPLNPINVFSESQPPRPLY